MVQVVPQRAPLHLATTEAGSEPGANSALTIEDKYIESQSQEPEPTKKGWLFIMAKPLIAQQQALIQALLLNTSVVSEAAALAGIPAQVALDWMRTHEARSAFLEVRKEITERLIKEAKAGKVAGAMVLASLASPGSPDPDLAALAQADQAKVRKRQRQFIKEMQAYLRLPLEQLLVYR